MQIKIFVYSDVRFYLSLFIFPKNNFTSAKTHTVDLFRISRYTIVGCGQGYFRRKLRSFQQRLAKLKRNFYMVEWIEGKKKDKGKKKNIAGNNTIRSEISRRRNAMAMEDDLFSLSEYTRCAIRNLPLSAISRSGVSSAYSITRRKRNRRACARVFKARSHVGSCLRAMAKYPRPSA